MGGSIVILEGLNASGKTFCAETVSKRLSAPIIRPFRSDAEHLGREDEGLQERLHALGVPANTFVDDFYTSDFLVQTGLTAVLDRSMGSGVAYGLLYGNVPHAKRARELLLAWQESIQRYDGKVLYVHVAARREVRKQRCRGDKRWFPNVVQDKELIKWFDKVFTDITLEKIVIDTSDMPSRRIGEIGADWILKKLR